MDRTAKQGSSTSQRRLYASSTDKGWDLVSFINPHPVQHPDVLISDKLTWTGRIQEFECSCRMLQQVNCSTALESPPRGAAAFRKVDATNTPPGSSTLLISASCSGTKASM